jgi:hypothetical protein
LGGLRFRALDWVPSRDWPGIFKWVFTRKRCEHPRKDPLEVRSTHLLFDESAESYLVQLLSTLLQRSLSRLWR